MICPRTIDFWTTECCKLTLLFIETLSTFQYTQFPLFQHLQWFKLLHINIFIVSSLVVVGNKIKLHTIEVNVQQTSFQGWVHYHHPTQGVTSRSIALAAVVKMHLKWGLTRAFSPLLVLCVKKSCIVPFVHYLQWTVSRFECALIIAVKSLHNRDIIVVHFNNFHCMKICNTLMR